ncbi:hypothetical protein CYMTET_8718 [Cymbomonas tetramitiformis]|uniref:Uncharacterized protein n=1 Tax=Cymbomonas tetramitiformis TaxID=36881 RepID=A0AAE0LG81_9CHLO|nr:hypothetical protein CYMTET_8718 [Cymbomonas tetramitiformis]
MDTEAQAEFDEIMSRDIRQPPNIDLSSANGGGYLRLKAKRELQEKRNFKFKLLGALLSEYQTRSHIRKRYLLLFGYLAFFGMYLIIVRLQSNPTDSFKVLEGVRESLLPHEDNGDLQKFFTSVDQIEDWLLEKVDSFWEPAECGDSLCTHPEEYAAWSSFGCASDCGALPTSPIHVHITTYSSLSETGGRSEEDGAEHILWNVCSQEEYDGEELCWHDPWDRLASHRALNVRLDLPDADWHLKVIKPSYVTVNVVLYLASQNVTRNSTLAWAANESTLEMPTRRRLQSHLPLSRPTYRPAPRRPPLGNATPGRRDDISPRRRILNESSGAVVPDVQQALPLSKWESWLRSLNATAAQQSFATAETCQELVLQLVDQFPNHYLECGGDDVSESCCQRYQALYEGRCWCALPVVDHGVYHSASTNPNENNPSAASAIMSTIVYDLRMCSGFAMDQYAMTEPLLCNHLTPPITQVEGVNAVACRYEFSVLFEQASTFHSCTTSAPDGPDCCAALLNLERYNCLCYDHASAGALAEADFSAVASLFESCNLTSPDCASLPPATYYPSAEQYKHSLYYRTSSSRRAVMRASDRFEYYNKWRSWDAELFVFEKSKVDAIKIALGVSWEEAEQLQKKSAAGELDEIDTVVTHCAEVPSTAPVGCAWHADFLFSMLYLDPCSEAVRYITCGEEAAGKECAQYVAGFGGDENADVLYGDLLEENFDVYLSACTNLTKADMCAQYAQQCDEQLPVILEAISDCIAADDLTVGRVNNATLDKMYLCASNHRWAAGGEPTPTCEELLYYHGSFEERWAREVYAAPKVR